MKKRLNGIVFCIIFSLIFNGIIINAETADRIICDTEECWTNSTLTPPDVSDMISCEWQWAWTADAPNGAWHTIGEAAAVAAEISLTQELAGKYIRFKYTDDTGDHYSDATNAVKYEHNLVHKSAITALQPDAVTDNGDGTYNVDLKLTPARPAYRGYLGVGADITPAETFETDGISKVSYYASLDVRRLGEGDNDAQLGIRIGAGSDHQIYDNWMVYAASVTKEWATYKSPYVNMRKENTEYKNAWFDFKQSVSETGFADADTLAVKNIFLAKSAPYIKNISVGGNVWPGETVTADFIKGNEYNIWKSGSTEYPRTIDKDIYKWYMADNAYGDENGNWTEIDGATAKELNINEGMSEKYIRVEVTPISAAPGLSDGAEIDTSKAWGVTVSSPPVQCRREAAAASDLKISSKTGRTDDILVPSYLWGGTDDEGSSVLKWYSSTDNGKHWFEEKTVTVSSAEVESLGYLMMNPAMEGKLFKVTLQPVSADGTAGKLIEAVMSSKITLSASFMNNGDFDIYPYGWSGSFSYAEDEDVDGSVESGALKIRDTAVFATEQRVGDNYKTEVSFYAKADTASDIKVKINDIAEQVFTVGQTYDKYSFEFTQAVNDITISIDTNGSTVCVDRISIRNKKPFVSELSTDGRYMVGDSVTAVYTLEGIGAAEDWSVFEWQISDNGTDGWTQCSLSKTMNFTEKHEGKYFRFKITPKDMGGIEGDVRYTDVTQCTVQPVGARNLTVTTDTGLFKSNSYLYPSYEYFGNASEGLSILEWQMCDLRDAPDEYWKTCSYTTYNKENSDAPKTGVRTTAYIFTVNATNVQTAGRIPLNYDNANMYIRFKLTPKNSAGAEGKPVYSEPTPIIKYEPNLIADTVTDRIDTGWYMPSSNGSFSQVSDPERGNIIKVDARKSKAGENVYTGANMTIMLDGIRHICEYKQGYRLKFDMKLENGLGATNVRSKIYNGSVSSSASIYSKITSVNDYEWTTVTGTGMINDGHPVVGSSGETFYFEKNANTEGSGIFYLDNLFYAMDRPWSENIRISGMGNIGNTLTASYDFRSIDNATDEFSSKLAWYVSDTPYGPWTKLNKKTERKLNIEDSYAGKYIRFSVTPYDKNGNAGMEFMSENVISVPASDVVEILPEASPVTNGSLYERAVNYRNCTAVTRRITVAMTFNKVVNGTERQLEAVLQTVDVNPDEEKTFSLAKNIDSRLDSSECKLFVFDTTGGMMRFLGGNASQSTATDLRNTEVDYYADTESTEVRGNSVYTMPVTVLLLKPGMTITDLKEGSNASVIEYLTVVSSSADGSYEHCFGIAPLTIPSGTVELSLYRFLGGAAAITDTIVCYSDSAEDSAISLLLNAENVAELENILNGAVEIDGNKVADILALKLDYYNKLVYDDGKATVAGKLFSAHPANLYDFKSRLAEYSEAQIIEEERRRWNKYITDFINDPEKTGAEIEAFLNSQGYTPANVNWLDYKLDVDMKSKYGWKISLNEQDRRVFENNVISSIKGGETASFVEENFKNSVIVNAVNLANWDIIMDVLKSHENALGIDIEEKCKGLSTENYRQMSQDMAKTVFNDKQGIVAAFNGWKPGNNPENGNKSTESGGGTGGRGGASVGAGAHAAPLTPVETGKSPVQSIDSFYDMAKSHWAYDYMKRAIEKKIFNGFDDGTIRPDDAVTREQFVKILVSAFDLYDADAVCEFADVYAGDWSYKYVASAWRRGIVSGVGDNLFEKEGLISREDMAVMIFRTMKALGVKTDYAEEPAFDDSNAVADYAREAVACLFENEIINGVGNNRFSPKESATRAMAAKTVIILLEKVEKKQ